MSPFVPQANLASIRPLHLNATTPTFCDVSPYFMVREKARIDRLGKMFKNATDVAAVGSVRSPAVTDENQE